MDKKGPDIERLALSRFERSVVCRALMVEIQRESADQQREDSTYLLTLRNLLERFTR